MNQQMKKIMLSELRCVTCKFAESGMKAATGAAGDASDFEKAMVKAMTLNENLLSLGYTLKPADIVRLAGSPSLDIFFEEFQGLLGEVKAEPMYPGFPEQVMKMSEAQFRFDQAVHYFSTYGLEMLFGVEVAKGWLPCEEERKSEREKKKQDDERLLAAKVLELLDEEEAVFVLMKRVLGRRERMTLPEREFVLLGLPELASEELEQMDIPFKENLREIFLQLTDFYYRPKGDALGEADFRVLRALCKHTGDVLKCTACLLGYNSYHLRTSQKRFIVKLLESYPEADFRANLALSRKKAGQNLAVLQHLDYNIYSRSAVHKETVRAFRDGELRSWEGQARARLAAREEGALDFAAKRPGMMLRMTAWLVRLGYPAEEIAEKLCAGAEALSGQTLVTLMGYFGSPANYTKKLEWWERWRTERSHEIEERCFRNHNHENFHELDSRVVARRDERKENLKAEMDAVYGILREVFSAKLKVMDTPLKGKKIFLDMEEYDLEYSELQTGGKSEEGGYVRSGIAYRIPKEVRHLRFFVYWNDHFARVDVDLHASASTLDGQPIQVGWNADFRKEGIVSSGDITHSDAAEYIDIDLTNPMLRDVALNINLYYGRWSFGEIETCFTGMMAVKELGEKVKHYNPANCFFSHDLRGKCSKIHYGYVDVKRRCLVFLGKEDTEGGYYNYESRGEIAFSLLDYINCLLEAQGAALVQRKEEADLVMKMGKPEGENEISFIDNNFFLDN